MSLLTTTYRPDYNWLPNITREGMQLANQRTQLSLEQQKLNQAAANTALSTMEFIANVGRLKRQQDFQERQFAYSMNSDALSRERQSRLDDLHTKQVEYGMDPENPHNRYLSAEADMMQKRGGYYDAQAQRAESQAKKMDDLQSSTEKSIQGWMDKANTVPSIDEISNDPSIYGVPKDLLTRHRLLAGAAKDAQSEITDQASQDDNVTPSTEAVERANKYSILTETSKDAIESKGAIANKAASLKALSDIVRTEGRSNPYAAQLASHAMAQIAQGPGGAQAMNEYQKAMQPSSGVPPELKGLTVTGGSYNPYDPRHTTIRVGREVDATEPPSVTTAKINTLRREISDLDKSLTGTAAIGLSEAEIAQKKSDRAAKQAQLNAMLGGTGSGMSAPDGSTGPTPDGSPSVQPGLLPPLSVRLGGVLDNLKVK